MGEYNTKHGELVNQVRRAYINGQSESELKWESPLPYAEVELILKYFKGEEYNGRPGRHAPELTEEEQEYIHDYYLDEIVQKGEASLRQMWKDFCKEHRLVMFDRFKHLVDKHAGHLDEKVESQIDGIVDMKEELKAGRKHG